MIFKKLPKSRRSSVLSEDLAGLLAVVSLLFSCCSSEVLQMLCSTGTSTGICMIFFRHWAPVVYSRFRVRHWSDTVETLLAYPGYKTTTGNQVGLDKHCSDFTINLS